MFVFDYLYARLQTILAFNSETNIKKSALCIYQLGHSKATYK